MRMEMRVGLTLGLAVVEGELHLYANGKDVGAYEIEQMPATPLVGSLVISSGCFKLGIIMC